MLIDYRLLSLAQEFYKSRGYIQIEVPWMVDAATSQITLPNGAYAFVLNDGKHLVGSAEQGFLARYEEFSDDVCYFSVSPCFRNEPEDRTHQKVFMKLELFARGVDATERFVRDAVEFHKSQHARWAGDLKVVQTGERSFDLMLDSVEIGSYAFLNKAGMTWSCGTGLALPRFEVAEVVGAQSHGLKWAGADGDDDIWASLAELEE